MAYLEIINSTENCSFTVAIKGLHEEYKYEGRTFICEIRRSGTTEYYRTNPTYEGSIPAYAPSVDASEPIIAMLSPGGIVMNDIESYTLYDIRVTISNIQGSDDVVLEFLEHESGFGNIPGMVPSVTTPIIDEFNVRQGQYGGEIIYNFKLSNISRLRKTSSGLRGTEYVLSYKQQDEDDGWWETVFWKAHEDNSDTVEETGTIQNLKFATQNSVLYEVELKVINYYKDKEITTTETRIVRVAPEIPLGYLHIMWSSNYPLDSSNYPYLEGTSHELVCINHPHFNCEIWNDFIDELAIIVKEAEIRYHVKFYVDDLTELPFSPYAYRGDSITNSWITLELILDWLYNDACHIQNEYYDTYHYVKGKEITPETINAINKATFDLRTLIYELSYD